MSPEEIKLIEVTAELSSTKAVDKSVEKSREVVREAIAEHTQNCPYSKSGILSLGTLAKEGKAFMTIVGAVVILFSSVFAEMFKPNDKHLNEKIDNITTVLKKVIPDANNISIIENKENPKGLIQ